MADSFDKVVEALEANENARVSNPHYVSDENRRSAIAAHELFCILLSGGFTETQACKVIAARMMMDTEED